MKKFFLIIYKFYKILKYITKFYFLYTNIIINTFQPNKFYFPFNISYININTYNNNSFPYLFNNTNINNKNTKYKYKKIIIIYKLLPNPPKKLKP